MDVAVKWRYFNHLFNGDDPDSERVYLWHIERRRQFNAMFKLGMDPGKETPDDYINSCRSLADSMRGNGYDKAHPIPVSPDREILGGAHRLACALALGCDVWADVTDKQPTAPTWGFRWFWMAEMPKQDRARMLSDWEKMFAGK